MQKQRNTKPNFRSRYLAVFGVLGIAVASLVTQLVPGNSASAAGANFTVSLTIPGSIVLNVDPAASGGFGEAKTASKAFQVSTNSPSGYTLQLKSKDQSTNDLTGVNLPGQKITSISSEISSASASSTFEANTWGYKPDKFNKSANTNYRPAPSGATVDLLDETSAANLGGTPTDYELAIAAKVDSNIAYGEYSNTYTIVVTAKTVHYKVTYDLNGGSGSFPDEEGDTNSSAIIISRNEPEPEREDGSEFGGWCLEDNSADPSQCSGSTVEAGGTLDLNASNNTFKLWAIWTKGVETRTYTLAFESQLLPASVKGLPYRRTKQKAYSDQDYQINLPSETPTLSGYTFKGWCTVATSDTTCSGGSTFQPSGQIQVKKTGEPEHGHFTYIDASQEYQLTLYAMWASGSGDEARGDLEIIPPSRTSSTLNCASSAIPASPAGIYGDATWTTTIAACDWESAVNACPAGFHLPSELELQALLGYYGSGSALYNAGWNDSPSGETAYWSATVYTDGGDTLYSEDAVSGARTYASSLYVGPGYARVGYGYSYDNPIHYVRCIAG